MKSPNAPEAIVKEVFSLYEKHGDEDYIGEPVSQLEHMSQAALLAEEEGYDDEVILAAFFHDIGHLCAEEGEVANSVQPSALSSQPSGNRGSVISAPKGAVDFRD